MRKTTQAILDANRGRAPDLVKLKLKALRRDAFSFFRGTAPLFYQTLHLPRALSRAPTALVCGDLHLENFGAYKGDNRLAYFDLNDFDEACVAPVSFDLVRFLAGLHVAAARLKIRKKEAESLASLFVETYAATLATTKPRWLERATATGPVKTLLQGLKNRHRIDLIGKRTVRQSGKTKLIIDGTHTLEAGRKEQDEARSILAAYASTQPQPAFFESIDVARRIAGNGSLGLARYVALVRGNGGEEGRYLIDIKRANPSALAATIRTPQPPWACDGGRVVWLQRIAQAIPPALLGAVHVGRHSYIVKELQPTADRLNLAAIVGKPRALTDVVRTMALATAWAHLRGASRFGADDVDKLSDHAKDTSWHDAIAELARSSAAGAIAQWDEYSRDYDDGSLLRLLN